MPARRRRNQQTPDAELDPVSQFGRMLREASEREQAERDRQARRRQEAKDAARAEAERAAALVAAQRELDRAIEAVKTARASRRGVAEADAAWRDAKARLIELETGERPAWQPDDSAPPPEVDTPDP